MSKACAPNQLHRLACIGRGVFAAFCFILVLGFGATANKSLSISQILGLEVLFIIFLGLAIILPFLGLGAGRISTVLFWGVAASIFAGSDSLARFIQFSQVGVNDYRLKPARFETASFQGIRFEAIGDSANAGVMIDVDGRQVARLGGLLDHSADVSLPAGSHEVKVRVSGSSGPSASVEVKPGRITNVEIPIKVGGSRQTGIRTFETDVSVGINPTSSSTGSWILERDVLVHRDPRQFYLSLLRLIVIDASFAAAMVIVSRKFSRLRNDRNDP
jgi:hypothetical protein